MNTVFSNLPDTLSAEHEATWQGMVDLFFAATYPIGRRLPSVIGHDGNPITGPWRVSRYADKIKATVTTHETVDKGTIAMHLSGNLYHGQAFAWLQSYAASWESKAVYTAVDFDVEGEAHGPAPEHFRTPDAALEAVRKLMAVAQGLGLKAHLEITKSAGYRVWIFHNILPAVHARDLGRLLLQRSDLHPAIEVFPKTTFLMEGQVGSAVFVPYNGHNARRGRQVIIDPGTQDVRMVEEFVADALAHRSDPALIAQIVTEAEAAGELKPTVRQERTTFEGESRLATLKTGEAAKAWANQTSRCAALGDIMRRCEDGARISRAEWFALATHLKVYGSWGYDEFHRLSATDGRYNLHQADGLWDSIQGGPMTCAKMDCGKAPQEDCALPEGKTSAISFAYGNLWQLPMGTLVKARGLRVGKDKNNAMGEEMVAEDMEDEKALDLDLARLDRTDMGNAGRLLARYGDVMRYSPLEKAWYVWSGKLWSKHYNTAVAPMRLAAQAMLLIKREADTIQDDGTSAAHHKHALKSQSRERISAALSLGCMMEGLTVSPSDFDTAPELVSVENGTLDLRTQTLLPHRQEDMISAMMPVAYDPQARCPRFEQFMFDVIPDPDVRRYVQKWIGYGLTGLTREQMFLFLFGSGQNGKSTLLNVIRDVMGSVLHTTVASSTIMLDPSGSKNTALAMVPFVSPRSVTMTEGGEGARFDEELIKAVTGGDEVKARRHYELEFGFTPKLKLTIAANHKPRITGTDKGIWRRVRLVPFETVIIDVDKTLSEKLKAERSGILNWMLVGLAAYYKDGLETPKLVQDATDEYRQDSDVLGDYLDENCVKGTGKEFCVSGSDLYQDYSSWCFNSGHKAMATNTLANKLKDRGMTKGDGRLRRTWMGVRLRTGADDVEEAKKEHEQAKEAAGVSPPPRIMQNLYPSPENQDPSPKSGDGWDDSFGFEPLHADLHAESNVW